MENYLTLEKAGEDINISENFEKKIDEMIQRKTLLESIVQIQIDQWKTALDRLKEQIFEEI